MQAHIPTALAATLLMLSGNPAGTAALAADSTQLALAETAEQDASVAEPREHATRAHAEAAALAADALATATKLELDGRLTEAARAYKL